MNRSQTLERLFTRQEFDVDARAKFDRAVGWRYGLIFGVSLITAGWGLDAWELTAASVELTWAKIAIALIAILPLGIIAGSRAARVSFAPRLIIWIGAGAITGLIANRLPFEGASAIAAMFDAEARGVIVFLEVRSVSETLIPLAMFGALRGL